MIHRPITARDRKLTDLNDDDEDWLEDLPESLRTFFTERLKPRPPAPEPEKPKRRPRRKRASTPQPQEQNTP